MSRRRSRRTKTGTMLVLIPSDERRAAKNELNHFFIRASGSCSHLSQRLKNGRADARHPIADRPVDLVSDMLEREVDLVRLEELGRAWHRVTKRLVDLARGRRLSSSVGTSNGGRAA